MRCSRDSALMPGELLGRVRGSSPRQKDLIEAVPCTRSSQGFRGHLFRHGQRAALFVFMRTKLEKQEVFPMKAHLYHVKDTGTMALNFSTDDCLSFNNGKAACECLI